MTTLEVLRKLAQPIRGRGDRAHERCAKASDDSDILYFDGLRHGYWASASRIEAEIERLEGEKT